MPLDAVKELVRGRVIAERTSKAAKDRADKLFAELDGGESLEKIAEANKLKVETQQGIGREAVNVDSAIVAAAFALPRPAADKPERQLVTLNNDSYALLQLDAVTDADPSKLDAKTKEAARNTLTQAIAQTTTREFVDALRAGAKVRISAEKLEQQP
jgi:peptidyl-prolyl cis-trans isomerase D